MTTILNLEDLTVHYGKIAALIKVSIEIREGQIVTLLGANGAGKTTTIKSIMGLIPSKEGYIFLGGKNILGLKPHMIARLGIGFVPEDRRVFSSLTVLENLNLPVIRKRGEGWNLEKIYKYF